jgi:hypothetical protein
VQPTVRLLLMLLLHRVPLRLVPLPVLPVRPVLPVPVLLTVGPRSPVRPRSPVLVLAPASCAPVVPPSARGPRLPVPSGSTSTSRDGR